MRQTSAQIDHAILDVAAGIFATHGFAHTSVQQIADAVGYSKPGLLHRFGSKEALHRAVLAEVVETVEEIVSAATAHHREAGQLQLVLELVTRRALERPGMVQMMLRSLDPRSREPGIERIQHAGHRLIDSLDAPTNGPLERLRVALGLELIVNAATAQHSRADADLQVPADELVPTLVGLARHVVVGPL